MAIVNWLADVLELSPAALTVRAQTLPFDDTDEVSLWEDFYERENVPSVDLADVTTLDYRPAADRREWNAHGRRIPLTTPTTRKLRIVPIEANSRIDEYEMQKLQESAQGNAAVIRQVIGAELPARADMLAAACYRRLLVDCFTAWGNGNIVQKNPETGTTYTASFGFSSSRYTTAGTAWNDAGVNAYNLLLTWLASARTYVGEVAGVMLRLATFNVILADAPNLDNSVSMTRARLAERVQADLGGGPFEFFINENHVDVFTDGGTATAATKLWPAQKVAAIPVGMKVGRVAFAPVARAADLAAEAGPGGIDVRGVTIFRTEDNHGKSLLVEAQLNAVPVPDEQKLFVIDALV